LIPVPQGKSAPGIASRFVELPRHREEDRHRTYRGRNTTSRDFVELAVLVRGRPFVAPLLRAWLYDEAVPALAGYVAAAALREEGAALPPDVVGLRCGRGAHRGGSSDLRLAPRASAVLASAA
jgi:hypothetical protein